MHTVKAAFQKLKTILKFVWRHALTLINAYLTVIVFIEFSSISIKNNIMLAIGAALLDWLKMKIKFNNAQSFHHSHSTDTSLHVRDYWNSSVVGSPSYLSSIGTSSKYY